MLNGGITFSTFIDKQNFYHAKVAHKLPNITFSAFYFLAFWDIFDLPSSANHH